jgi:hypothetical protein
VEEDPPCGFDDDDDRTDDPNARINASQVAPAAAKAPAADESSARSDAL